MKVSSRVRRRNEDGAMLVSRDLGQFQSSLLLYSLHRRIAWFETTYAKATPDDANLTITEDKKTPIRTNARAAGCASS